MAGRLPGDFCAVAGYWTADEVPRARRDYQYWLGSGRARHGRRQWRDVWGGERRGDGFFAESGSVARAGGSSQLSGAWLDTDVVGRAGIGLLAAAGEAPIAAGTVGDAGGRGAGGGVRGFAGG